MSHRALKCLTALGFLLLACIDSSRAQDLENSRKPLEIVRLQLKWKHQFQFAGYYAAIENGYYRDEGLEVRLLEADEEEPAKPVLSGNAEYGIAASDLVLLRSEGKPVVALACIFQHSPLVILGSHRAGIRSVHDLAGKRVMIEHHAGELIAYLQKEKGLKDKLTFLPHRFDVSPLINGQVDAISAYLTDEPFELRRARFEYTMLSPRSGGIDFYGDTLFTTEEEIQCRPDRVKSFVKASLRGWQYALSHQEEMIGLILTKYSARHDREQLRHEANITQYLVMSDIVEIGYMNPARWRHIAEVYAEMGMVSPDFDPGDLIHSSTTEPRMLWFYASISGALLLLAIVFLVAVRFYIMARTIHRQMTVLKNASRHIQAAEGRYRLMAENAPFPILITHPSLSTIHYMNSPAAQQLHLTRNSILGNQVYDIYWHAEDRAKIYRQLEQEGCIRGWEVKLKTASGTPFWASLSQNLIDYDGSPTVVSSFVDITERKRFETVLKQSNDHLNAIIEFLPDPTFAIESNGRVMAWNKAMEEITGVPKADMVHQGDYAYAIPLYTKRRPLLINLILEPDPELQVTGFKSVDRQGDLLYAEAYAPEAYGGKGAHLWSAASVLRDRDGTVVGAIQTIRDITKIKIAEEEKLLAEERLMQAQKAESLGRLAGAVAHHYNNKLMAVMGNLELALSGLPNDSSARKNLIHAMEASRQAAEISRMMLTCSSQTVVRKESLALGAVVMDALVFLGDSLPPNIDLHTEIPSDGPAIQADAGHVSRILTNLVLNASEAIGTANGHIRVKVHEESGMDLTGYRLLPPGWVAESEHCACLSVSDDGCGLDKSALETIFDPFFSTKFIGRGLGLSMVLGLAKAYEGAIAVQSEPGIGTTFLVLFPVESGANAR